MFQNGVYRRGDTEGETVSVVIAGDVCPRYEGEEAVINGKSREILAGIQDVLDSADLRLVQWETVLSDTPAPTVKAGPNLITPPASADFIKAGKFDVALLANNHTGDHGPENILETIKIIEQCQVKTVGAGKDAKAAAVPLRLEKNRFKISIINVCEMEFGTAGEDWPGANAMNELENIEQIRSEKRHNDIVLIVIHGGNEYNPIPSPRMKQLYRAFARAGASAVINIHPHCPQGIEIYDNVPIVYSPGNFFFPGREAFDPNSFWWSGYLPKLVFDRKGAVEVEITPYIFSPNPWKIEALQGAQRQWFLDYIDQISGLMHTDGDYFYDLWCAFKYSMPLSWVSNAPAAALATDPADSEALKKLPAIRHMLTCQSHCELSKRSLLLLEQGKIPTLVKDMDKLKALQKADFAGK